jgi:hypothetical protein
VGWVSDGENGVLFHDDVGVVSERYDGSSFGGFWDVVDAGIHQLQVGRIGGHCRAYLGSRFANTTFFVYILVVGFVGDERPGGCLVG